MFYDDGLKFQCNGCSKCCRFKGGEVILSPEDLDRLCQWSQLTQDQFIKVYCKKLESSDGKIYTCLKTMHNSNDTTDCIFWDKTIPGCQCYTHRPVQCRTYPFWNKILESKEIWDKEKDFCPGINEGPEISKKEIERNLRQYEENKKKQ